MDARKATLTVSQLNDYLKILLDGDRVLSDVFVRGEVSNFTVPRSGHLYFTLKDAEGQLRSVMFRGAAERLRFRPADGMKVIAHGRISLYGPSGQYQLYVDDMVPDGAGALALQFEQLRKKLEAEGLFDEARKKRLPSMPSCVGIVTSPTGAAIHDLINILGRRFPLAEVILFPAMVQGAEAPEQLILGLQILEATNLCDVIIVGRGGGSAEDLWAFNDEGLARAIADCTVPVISAVGHESDVTICDFVADVRASTPSAAAELAVPNAKDVKDAVGYLFSRMNAEVLSAIAEERRALKQLAESRVLQKPEQIFAVKKQKVSDLEMMLDRAMDLENEKRKRELTSAAARLNALNPLSVLTRGYASVSRDGETLTRAAQLKEGDNLQLLFSDGSASATVNEVKGSI